MGTLKAAAVQAAPVWMDREATIDKVARLIVRAGAEGADVVAFSETFIPGYPWWVVMDDVRFAAGAKTAARQAWYLSQAVDLAREDLDPVIVAAQEADVFVSVGVAEIGPTGGSVYCSMVMISPDEGVVGVHRKLKPTSTERIAWSDGDGHGLRVYPWRGWRIGGLNCWENWLPLPRMALYSQGEQLHIMSWPGFRAQTLDPSRLVAIEGAMYVVSSSGMLDPESITEGFPDADAVIAGLEQSPVPAANGGSVICDPRGEVVAKAGRDSEEIIYADLDLAAVMAPREMRDQGGHYHRPDVFDFAVDRSRHVPATFLDE